MPRVERHAEVVWEGNVARGTGHISGQSGALAELPFTLATRIGNPEGKTSPEELIAAAHAACYAMSLSTELTTAGNPPDRLEVTSRATVDEVDGSHRITTIDVRVRARVADIDEDGFQQAVRAADEGCTVANVLRPAAEIRLDARLDS